MSRSHLIVTSLLLRGSSAFWISTARPAPCVGATRHLPLRLDDSEALGAVGDRARSALDAAIGELQEEEAAKKAAPSAYLRPEEREKVLEELQAQRRLGQPPPPPPPPVEEPVRALTLNQDALEERMSAPVAPPPPPPPPGSAMPSTPGRRRTYDEMLPLTPGAGGIRRQTEPDELARPPEPYRGVRLLQLDALERASLLLLLYLLAAGFGSSSTLVWDDGPVFTLRLAASALVVGHALIAGYGMTLLVGTPDADGEAGSPSEPVAAWFVRLLLTGPGGLRSLRKILAEGA